MTQHSEWSGPLLFVLGSKLFVDCSESDNIDRIVTELKAMDVEASRTQ